MDDQLTVSFEYSPENHATSIIELPDRRFLFKWWRPINVGFFAVFFTIQGVPETFLKGPPVASLVLVLFLLPMMLPILFMPDLVKRINVRRFRREKGARPDAIEIRRFGAEGFTPGSQWPQPIPWPMVTKAVESEGFFFVYHAHSNAPEYVPKAAMSGADIDGLRMMLRHQFEARPAALKLLATAEP